MATMKLLFCKTCGDVVKLRKSPTLCECGASQGRYEEDGHHAVVYGENARVIGMDNHDVGRALRAHEADNAWTIPARYWFIKIDGEKTRVSSVPSPLVSKK